MKIYYDAARAPNPRRVKIFLAEKGITVPVETVDMGAMAHKGEAFKSVNPMQRLPALELDDGTVLTESIAICRYFESLHPQPPLFGRDPKEQALVEMWQRRVEFHFLTAVSNVFRHSHPAMAALETPQVPAFGEANKPKAMEFLEFMNGELGKRQFVAGKDYTVADITFLVSVDFMKPVKLPIPDSLTHVKRWHAEVSARPSSKA
jgi:glutathione S-transferase